MAASLQKYYSAFARSQTFLNKLMVEHFPLEPKDLIGLVCDEYNLDILYSSDRAYGRHCTSYYGYYKPVSDGKCTYDAENNLYLIIVNEDIAPKRQKFTLLHEVAHIVLGHLDSTITELERGSLYYFFEGEANTFAGNALVPPILLHEYLNGSEFNSQKVQRRFGVSREAARNREIDYKEWLMIEPSPEEISLRCRCARWMRPDGHELHMPMLSQANRLSSST